MTTILLRTALVYFFLLLAMRLMGKRQIGELEISDLVTTLLVSEIASLPITDSSMPLHHALIPIAALSLFEVGASALVASFPRLKGLLTARPATLIRDGVLCGKEMRRARLSADELISELRQQGVTDVGEVRYAILEQNGKISVIPKAAHRPPTCKELKLSVDDVGLYRIVIDKGVVNRHSLLVLGLSRQELDAILRPRGLRPRDVYLLMMNERHDLRLFRREDAGV